VAVVLIDSLLAPVVKGKVFDSAAAGSSSSAAGLAVATTAVAESASSEEDEKEEDEVSAVDDDADDGGNAGGGGTGSVKMGRKASTTKLVCPSVVFDTTTCARSAHGT